MMVRPANAQTIPKPSVPEFTLHYVPPQIVPATTPIYTTDPNRVEHILTPAHPVWHVRDYVEIIINKNQIFSPYIDSKQNQIALYYNVSYKEHNENNWNYYYVEGLLWGQNSTSDTTIIPFNQLTGKGGIVDFRVEAQIGYYIRGKQVPIVLGFVGQTSGWSNSKSITVPARNFSPAPSPIVPDFSALPISFLIIAMATVGLLVYIKKHKSKEA